MLSDDACDVLIESNVNEIDNSVACRVVLRELPATAARVERAIVSDVSIALLFIMPVTQSQCHPQFVHRSFHSQSIEQSIHLQLHCDRPSLIPCGAVFCQWGSRQCSQIQECTWTDFFNVSMGCRLICDTQ